MDLGPVEHKLVGVTSEEFTSGELCTVTFHHKKDHIKICLFTKFEVLSLDCNHVEGFQKSEKIETLYGFGGPYLRIRKSHLYGIWATFDRSQPGYYTMKHSKLGKLTNFYVIFLVMEFIFSYDAI